LRRLLFAGFAALALMLPAGFSRAALQAGGTPPDELGKSLAKDPITVSKFHGRVVVVTFWASWCGPCRRELPALDALKREAGDRAEVIAVNVQDSVQDYHAITRQLKGTPMIFTHDTTGRIAKSYKVESYPNLYVIDKSGLISKVHVGFGEDSLTAIVEDINKLL
jgi:thiol-disulfide isomerase/thioredoxin